MRPDVIDILYNTAVTEPVKQSLNSQKTPCASPSRASSEVSIVRIFTNIYNVIMVPHCTHSKHCGPLFTEKMPSYRYRNPHYKPETVVRPSQVYNGDSYSRFIMGIPIAI